tara:strand:- start:11777 stop:13090 length:1314 start_codon:yes stop_codon:yes gene_type:complete
MLVSKLTNCKEGGDIQNLLDRIDCKLSELSYAMYNNVTFMLNINVPSSEVTQLLTYRNILINKQINLKLSTAVYKVGDLLDGGVVAGVLPNNEYLIVSLINYFVDILEPFELKKRWSLTFDLIGTSVNVGDGVSNTDKIIKFYGKGDYAAYFIKEHFGTDWSLPSKDELNQLQNVKSTLEAVSGFEPFMGSYWSSSEGDSIDAAWIHFSFNTGVQTQYNKTNRIQTLRAIKLYKSLPIYNYVKDYSIEDITGKVIRLTTGCNSKCSKTSIVFTTTTTTTAAAPSIGTLLQGGIVASSSVIEGQVMIVNINESGTHEWSSSISFVAGTQEGLREGKSNTDTIVAEGYPTPNAASVCRSISGSWDLPSKDELNELYVNLTLINLGISNNGGDSLATGAYWSSTQYDYNLAWYQDFFIGDQDGTSKGFTTNVRAVKWVNI